MFDVERKEEFKSNQTKKRVKKRLDKSTKKIIIICGSIFLIVFLLFYVYNRKQNENYNNIKRDKSEYLVYTKYKKTNSSYKVFVPYVNIKGNAISQVNKDIDLFTGEFIRSKMCSVIYEYDINGIILSLVVKVIDNDTEYAPDTYYRSYNINLATLEVIADDALLDFFGTDLNTVESLISNQFKYYYQELVNEEYYHSNECNYNCFLSYRGVDDYMENVSYYVKNGDLIAYRPFTIYSIYGEEEYFEDEDYEFVLVQTEKN